MENSHFVIIVILVLSILLLIQKIKFSTLKSRIIEEKRLKVEICEIRDRVLAIEDSQEAYEYLLDSVIKIIKKCNRGSILVMQEDGSFKYAVVKRFRDELENKSFKLEELYLYQYNRCVTTAIIDERSKFELIKRGFNSVDLDEDVKSILAAPIIYSGDLKGIISVDILEEGVHFTEDDIITMRYIRGELEGVIKNTLTREKLKYIATHDELTNLYNRRKFNKIFQDEISKISEFGGEDHFTIIDLDNFKAINDTYGHSEGDRTLLKMAESMRLCLNKDDYYGRMSGDEFVIIFRNITLEEAKEKLEEIRVYLRANNGEVKIDFTYGMVTINKSLNMQVDEIFSIADKKLYEAKRKKKVGR